MSEFTQDFECRTCRPTRHLAVTQSSNLKLTQDLSSVIEWDLIGYITTFIRRLQDVCRP
jgi:hypothetical protein